VAEAAVLDYLKQNDIDIIVVDGACSADFSVKVMTLALSLSKFLVLCVSGHSIPGKAALLTKFSSGIHPVRGIAISSLIVNGFTLAEYEAATGVIVHGFADNTPALRQERYYYAGGCAGIYYGFDTTAEIKSFYKDKLSGTVHTSNFFSTCDNLLQTYMDGGIVVSEYVAKELSSHVDASLLSKRGIH
jgi:hypothetical protein